MGSDTMLPLNRHLATTFMSTHPGAVVVVEGGGTGVGARALIDGRVDLAAASRALAPDEVEALFNETGTLGIRYLVALDAIAIYLHPDNPVTSLSFEQLGGLFSGRMPSWRSVGGGGDGVAVVIRPPTSGTHRFFRDHVLAGGPYASCAVTVRRTQDVIAAVASNADAIGYGGLAYSGDVVHAAVDGIAPNPRTIREGAYPLARYLFYYATEPPDGIVRTYVDWVIGPEGQEAVAETGLLALWAPSE